MTNGRQLKTHLKRAAFGLLTTPVVNRSLVRPLRHVERIRGSGRVHRLPVVGSFTARGFGGCAIQLTTAGRDSIASRLFWRGLEGFEPESLGPFHRLAKVSAGVLDIGANTGVYALVAAAANPDAVVIAFEPVPEIFEYLAGNARLNAFAHLRLEQLALGDHDGQIEFFVPVGVTLATGGSAAIGFRPADQTLTVTCTTLDEYLDDHRSPQIDLIKMDTESTEPTVLDGASATLARCRPTIICEVLKGRTEQALHDRLAPQEYRYFLMTANGLEGRAAIEADGSYRYKNYLFVPEERIDWVRRHAGVPVL